MRRETSSHDTPVAWSAMALPMYLLYEIGIVMAGLLLKDKIAARLKEDAEREAGA